MGCDIHLFAEKRENEAAPWVFLPAPPTEGYMPGEKPRHVAGGAWPYRYGAMDITLPGYVPGYETYGDEDPPGSMRDWFDDRNYCLFGMLANVRNGVGFAGIPIGEPVEPIAMPRGWPEDCCPELQAERANIEHTPSWLTVAEMQSYFADLRKRDLVVIGCLSGAQYEALQRGQRPKSCLIDIVGPDIITLDARIYDLIPRTKIRHVEIDGDLTTMVHYTDLPLGVCVEQKLRIRQAGRAAPAEARVYVRAQWRIQTESVTDRFEHCLAEMVEAARVGPENIRAVFYFDS